MSDPPGTWSGVRVRVLATVLTLTAIGMALAGTITTVAELGQFRDQVDLTLTADVEHFRAIAAAGQTAEDGPITDLEALMTTALRTQIAAQGETYLAVVGGREFVPGTERPVKLETLPPVLAVARETGADDRIRIRQVSTDVGPVRLAVVPARVGGDPRPGRFVIGYPMRDGERQVMANARTYALVSGACLALVGLAGWLVAGRLLRPLRLLRTAAEHISHSDLSLRIPVRGHDDVSDLTRTVNAMLDRLQAAFETQQHFLDDAGHELRTPLTIVRGHLEVLDPTDPREAADVRNLVLDELDRMGRLVDDLIVLARAGRPDFLRERPLDLDRLVDEVADKAAALGRRHWRVDARPGVGVVADPQRLTQALLQLTANAVRHTRPSDEIGIGAAVAGPGLVRIWVRDTGTGVRPEDAERIFERFGRSGAGRGDEGSGLGLAIVTAIAAAHGGRVQLDSRPGHGATFTLLLPLAHHPHTDLGPGPTPGPGPTTPAAGTASATPTASTPAQEVTP